MKKTRRLALILAAAMTVATPALAQQGIQRAGQFIDVWNNRGGNVLEMVQTRQELASSGRTVRIRGYCRSACTLYLTMANACLGPKATVGFHAPRLPGTRIIPPLVDQIMAAHYRGGILRKWNDEWRYTLEMTKLSARQVKALDPQIRLCAR